MSKSITKQVIVGQVKKFRGFFNDAIDKFVLKIKKMSKQFLQQLIANGVEFQRRVRITVLIRELSKSYDHGRNTEVSFVDYDSGYKYPKPISVQIDILQGLIPRLGGVVDQEYLAKSARGEIRLPELAEGLFAIPNWKKHPEIFGKTYASAVQKVMDLLKKSRGDGFFNHLDGELNEENFRQRAETKDFFAELIYEQGNPDILLVPAQFGIARRSMSACQARRLFNGNEQGEAGLGVFHIGIMLLTHPDRMKSIFDLKIDCVGDELFIEYWRRSWGFVLSFVVKSHYWLLNRINFQVGDHESFERFSCGAPSAFSAVKVVNVEKLNP